MPGLSVKVDLRGIHEKLSPQSIDRGKYVMLNQMHSDMNRFVPMMNGDLRSQSGISSGNVGLFWQAPYARKMFYVQFSRYSTGGTGPRWDLKAKSLFMSDWTRAFMGGAGL